MKKFYATQAASNLSHSRFPDQRSFVRTLSLAGMVVFLSNILPVSAGVAGNSSDGKPNTVETASIAANNDPASSPVDVNARHVSGGDPFSRFAVSARPVLVSALESDPAALTVDVSARTESLEEDSVKQGPRLRSFSMPDLRQISALESDPSALNGDISTEDETLEANTVNKRALFKRALFRSFSMPDLNQPMARGFTPFSAKESRIATGGLTLGDGASAGVGSIAIGQDTRKPNDASKYWVAPKAEGKMSMAIGLGAKSPAEKSIAIGQNATVKKKDAERSVVLGDNASASVVTGVALGAGSDAVTASGIVGYSPKTGEVASTLQDIAWKSTYGAASIGVFNDSSTPQKTRQLVGLSAGTQDTDAVNVAQLKELREMVVEGWKFTIDGANSTNVSLNSKNEIDFSSGSANFKIAKGEKDNKVTFDLAKELELDSIKTGTNTLDKTGLLIANGPEITKDGISAGSKKITNVATGTENTDAVNFAQLKAIQAAVAIKGFKINTTSKDFTDAIAAAENSIAIGSNAIARAENSIAIGSDAAALAESSIAIGQSAFIEKGDKGVAIGSNARVYTESGVALGDNSTVLEKHKDGVVGYSPKTGKVSTSQDGAWRSGTGAVSVGVYDQGTGRVSSARQIVGVSAGTEDNDAVNVAQLKELREMVVGGWQFTIGGKNPTNVGLDTENAVDFSAGSGNFEITKGDKGNNIKFDLAKNIAVDKVKVATNVFDATGLVIGNGPKVTTAGISAGSRKITEVAEGASDTDAVNFAQLKAVQAAVAIKGLKINTTSKDFTDAVAAAEDSIAIGSKANVDALSKGAIAFGHGASVKNQTKELGSLGAIALGENATVSVRDGIALGSYSVADVDAGVAGYDPRTRENTPKQDNTWLGGLAALSIGNAKEGKTRQIVGVAAGTADTDAVNVAQLKALQNSITPSWDLSVNGKNKTNVNSTSPMDLAAGSTNITLTKGEKDNNVKFDLARGITVDKIEVGNNTLDATGLVISDGPKITTSGIDAGSKRITGVGNATADTDAVNFAQLNKVKKEVEQQVAANSFVKQDAETLHITIGKDTGGDRINIANNKGETRTLTGVKDGDISKNSTDAVNGSQLFATNSNITKNTNDIKEANSKITKNAADITKTNSNISSLDDNISKYLGGGASVLQGKEPTYTVQKGTYHDVGSAFAGVDSSFTKINNEITEVAQKVDKNALLWNDEKHAFVARHEHKEEGKEINSRITSLADGVISIDSTDAVAGNQLYRLSRGVETSLGGGAKYDNGRWSPPTFKVKSVKEDGKTEEKDYHDVATALSEVGSSITNVQNKVTEQVNNVINKVEGESVVKWDEKTKSITIGKEKDGNVINLQNKDNENRTISGLIGGKISKDSNEAVNGSQLYSLNNDIAHYFDKNAGYNEDGKWTAPTFKFKTVNADGTEKDNTYYNVADAFAGVGTSITNVKKEITNQINKVEGDSLVKWDEKTKFITIGKEKDGTVINIANKDKKDRILSGVKAGQNDNEAVNKGQLDESLKDLSNRLQSDESAVVHYDKGDTNGSVNYTSVTLGKGKGSASVGLHNVADGTIAKDSHDAITGGQVNKIGEDSAKFLGGTSSFTNGSLTQPTYQLSKISKDGTVGSTSFHDVGTAFAGLDTNIKNVNDRIKEVSQGVAQDSLNWSPKNNAFVATHGAGDAKSNSKITSLKAGIISSLSTDAVNGSQLYSLGTEVAKFLGGNAEYKDGKWTAPTFTLKMPNSDGTTEDKNYKSVAEAFEGVGASITNVKKEITNQINKVEGDSLVKWDEKTKFITIGKEKDGTVINIANKDKEDRTLSGVKKAENANEAVNKGQLDESLAKLSNDLQSDESAVVHYDRKEGENGGINYASVTLGGKDKTSVALHNVADGKIAKDSHDAITGGQINTVGNEVAQLLGGNTSFKDGSFTGTTYNLSNINEKGEITDKTFSDVGSAFTGLNTNIDNVNKRIKEVSQSVAQDSLNWSTKDNAFVATHGETKSNSKITSLQNGAVSKDSTDAVNGSQLFDTNEKVAAYLGGKAEYKDGKWTAPTFTLKMPNSDGITEDKNYKSVAEAFEGVGASITNVKKEITNQINKVEGDSLVKWDEKTKFITIGKEKDGTVINIANKDKEDRTLSGVKKAENANEAVNKGQLDESLAKLSNDLQSDESAVVHYDRKEGENGGINYASVTLGGKDKTSVALHNVADGKIAKDSHDAITGGQINTVGNEVAQLLGGNTSFKDGSFTGTTYNLSNINEKGEITDKTFSDVGSAFTGLNTNIDNVNKRIKEVSQSVAQDSLNWSTKDNAFVATHGETKSNSKITSLQNGAVSKDSTDAVNGSQLFDTNEKVAAYLGGKAEYKDGKWTAPTFTLKMPNSDGITEDKNYKSVAEAFEGVGASITNVKKEITNQINKVEGDSLVKWDDDSQLIKIGAEKHGNKVTIADQDSKDRTLSGVKKAENANEAVNKGQLDESLAKLSNSLQSDESAVVHYDKKADDNNSINYASVTFGKGKDSAPVGLHNVADGQISESSHDAITGGQVNKIGKDIAKFLGGESSFTNGSLTQPTYKLSEVSKNGEIEDAEFKDVGSAFTGLDKNIKNVNQRIKEVSQGVAQDSLNWNKEAGAFVATHGSGDAKSNSKITSLQNGTINEKSTDAIAGQQLHALGNDVAAYFGGNASYKNGTWIAPKFTLKTVKEDGSAVEEQSYGSVAAAFEGRGTSFKNLHKEVTQGNTEVSENIKQNALLWSDEDKAFVATHGKDGEKTNSKIKVLANGDISASSTEAVNGSQLYSLNTTLAQYFGGDAAFKDGIFTGPTYKLSKVSQDGKVEKAEFKDVGLAFSGLDGNIKNVNDRIKDVSESVAQDSLNWNKEAGAFVATHGKDGEKTNSKIKFLANGDISASSTEAVNGSQLYSLNTTLAQYFGGDAAFKDGIFTGPTYKLSKVSQDGKVEKAEFKDVGLAFSGLDENIKNVNDRIKDVSESVAQDSLNWNKEAGAFVATHGKDGAKTNSKITSLQNGDISASSTDAVAGQQLHALGNDVAAYFGGNASYKNGTWIAPKFTLKTVKEDGSAVEEQSYGSVAAAFEGIGTSFKNLHKEVTQGNTEVSENIKQNALLWSDEDKAFVATHGKDGEKTNSKITSLQNGDISASSTDAVAGQQLHALGNEVAAYFGGDASYENGSWKAPSFKVNIVKEDGSAVEEQSYGSVAEAFAGVGSSFTNIHNEVKNKISQVVKDSLVKQDEKTKVIKIGGEQDGTTITIADKDNKDRILSGVKAAANDNEAVNKGQLDKGLKDLSNSLQSEESAVVLYDKGSDGNTNYGSVTFGKGKDSSPVGLHNVANGQLSEGSHDVVTGGQINTISQDVAKFLGGDAGFKNGAFTGPTYQLSKVSKDGHVEKHAFKDVGSAFSGLDENIKNVNDRIKDVSESVAQDSLNWNKDEGAFVATHGEKGGKKTNSKIKFLANGDIAEGSTEAVNGSQLYSMSNTLATYLGGGAGYANGEWHKPDFKVNVVKEDGSAVEEKSYKTVAEAFAGVGSSFTNIHKELKTEIKKVVGDSLVKQDADTKVIKIGAEKGGSIISIANSGDASRTLSGVKSGALSEESTQAVNGSQLFATNQHVSTVSTNLETAARNIAKSFGGGAKYENDAWTVPSFKVKSFEEDGKIEDKEYPDVASAFAGVGSSFTNVNNRITNVKDEITKEISQVVKDSLVKQDEKTKVIKIGGEQDGTTITIADKDNKDRILSGVKAAANDNEAVNKGQLDKGLKDLSNSLQSEESAVVLYDKGSDGNTNYGSVTFGKGKDSSPVGLHNVANGQLSEGSHDVVTGGQINTISQDVAKFLGGDAGFKNGAFTGPTYQLSKVSKDGHVEKHAFKDVGSAFSGLDENIKNVNDRIKDVSESVAQDSLNWNKDEGAFVATHGEKGGKKTNSKIKFLANGDIAEGSTEAVNGSQLYSMSNTLATYLGGGAGYANGEWHKPDFKVNVVKEDGSAVEEKSYKTVAEAFAGVGSSFTNIHKELKTEIKKVVGDSLVKQDADTKVIKIGAEKGGSIISIANSGDASRTLSGVKSGVLSKESTEAVNGSQLYSMNNTLAAYLGGGAGYANGEWHKPDFKVNVVKEDGSAVEEKSYKTVAEAFAGVGSSFTNIHKELKTEIKKVVGDSLVKQNEETHVISIGGEKSGTEVKLANVDGASRTLSGVKSGALSEESTQAVNGSQLFATNQHVSTVSTNLETAATDIAKSFGGGAKYEGGVWTAPKFTVKSFEEEGKVSDETYHDVASAFAGVGSSFSNVNNRITNVKDEITKEINQVVSDSLVKQDETTKVIKIGAEKEGTAITIANSNGDARSLSGVKAAILSESSTEAVNGGQLYSLNKTLATYFGGDAQFADGKWTPPSFKVLTFNDDGSSKEESYPDITAAFAGVSSSFKKLHKELSDNSDKVEQNALLWSDEENAFVALHGQGSDRSKSKLKSLLDGDISEGSTEAVTGNQLYALNTTLATYFGGGAKYENGVWTPPSFNVAQFNSDGSSSTKESHDVAGAFNTVSESMTNINNRIKDVSDNIDKNSLHWNEEQGAYDASHNGEASHITNIANGEIKAGSQDAVNGGQLWETNERVTKVENRVDTLDKHVQDIEIAVTDGAVNYDKGADGKKTNSITLVGGNESDPVLIDNVADGKIETGSKQAVNGGQLHDYTKDQMKIVLDDAKKYTDDQVGSLVNKGVNEAKSYTDMKFETLSYAVEDVRKEARQAAAIGLAVSNLSYDDTPGKLSISFGSGLWYNQSAIAFGAGYTSEDGRIRSNVSATSAGGRWGVGAGLRITLN
ncbi:Vomp family autotransporter [Bartonella machadoae]|uniref:Vomp family autotransporter n=1 Tax=Bartonella machadoae TaxID=2893471 RepID=UPI001F4D008E|nr:Vomp family autotransporter [Bartonella machadoae]UNE54515.1 Vomp family autotransporter [Bartonella machadoae]